MRWIKRTVLSPAMTLILRGLNVFLPNHLITVEKSKNPKAFPCCFSAAIFILMTMALHGDSSMVILKTKVILKIASMMHEGDGNIWCKRILPFIRKYLKTINLRQQQGRNTRKDIDFYLNGMFSSPFFGV